MSGPNFWNNGIEILNPTLIPWGTYNVGKSTPDIEGWLRDFGPTGSMAQYAIVLQPSLQDPGPQTTVSLEYQIVSGQESATPCWGTLWFAFVPYNPSTGALQGGTNSRIFLLAIDSGTASGWYYMDQLTDSPALIASLDIDLPVADAVNNLWVYFDYKNQTAYVGTGTSIGVGGVGGGVALPGLMASGFQGYLMAFIKSDAGDPTSSWGGVGPVRLWSDAVACCAPNGVTGSPPGSMDCSTYTPANESCNNTMGTNQASPPTGYCGVNPTDPICACVNGQLPGVLNYCFGVGCDSDAYWGITTTPDCSAKCIDVTNILAGGNVDIGQYNLICGSNPIVWLEQNWEVASVVTIAIALIAGLFLLFRYGWL